MYRNTPIRIFELMTNVRWAYNRKNFTTAGVETEQTLREIARARKAGDKSAPWTTIAKLARKVDTALHVNIVESDDIARDIKAIGTAIDAMIAAMEPHLPRA